jgi:hypothetical protein
MNGVAANKNKKMGPETLRAERNDCTKYVTHNELKAKNGIALGNLLVKSFPSLSSNLSSCSDILLRFLIKKEVSMAAKKPIIPIHVKKGDSMYSEKHETNQILSEMMATFKLYLLCFVQNLSLVILLNRIFYIFIIPHSKHLSKLLLGWVLLFIAHNSSFAEDYTQVIREAEKKYGIPKGLLQSIVITESDIHPWTVNSSKGFLYAKNKEEALERIKELISQGVTNIDIGLTQINYRWHMKNFSTIEEILEPKNNIEYAAKLLVKLQDEHKEWHLATAYYHSYNPVYYKEYFKKVLLRWLNLST